MSGANIKISENKDSADSRRMSISGLPEAVRTAHQLIAARYDKRHPRFLLHLPGTIQATHCTLSRSTGHSANCSCPLILTHFFVSKRNQNGVFFRPKNKQNQKWIFVAENEIKNLRSDSQFICPV